MRSAPVAAATCCLALLLLLQRLRPASAGGAQEDEEELRLEPADLSTSGGSAPARPRGPPDPFAFTFEDYLREAGRSSGHHLFEAGSEWRAGEQLAYSAPAAGPSLVEAEAEVEANSIQRAPAKRPEAERISPAATSGRPQQDGGEPANGQSKDKEQQSSSLAPNGADKTTSGESAGPELARRRHDDPDHHREHHGERHKEHHHHQQQQERQVEGNKQEGSTMGQHHSNNNQIRLQFAWRALPTNKCSRPCGRGSRVNHLSCLDLKFQVRVADEFCLNSPELPRPSELSDEPCAETDCRPEWAQVEYQQCNADSDDQAQGCRPSLLKRIECQMVNRLGQTIRLDDSHCGRPRGRVELGVEVGKEKEPTGAGGEPIDDESSVELNSEELLERERKRNEILPSRDLDTLASWQHLAPGRLDSTSLDEPLFEPGPWSQCSGAPCGQLGRRHRKLTCRLYLARSAKFVQLPESACQTVARAPHSSEPCYMDCPPELEQPASGSNGTWKGRAGPGVVEGDGGDEPVYDLEVARFVWRHNGWTKCSAECLGGRSESLVECWDKVAETSVEPEGRCEPSSRPQPLVEPCNEVPCAPEWRLEPFSECSRKCGSAGIRSRSVACVQQVASLQSATGSSSHMLVSNDLCLQATGSPLAPAKIEPCNRFDCRPEWSVGPWGECSRKCGLGVRNRTVICVQEFASRDGPADRLAGRLSPDLMEAVIVGAGDWQPGKASQVPFQECYEEYRSVPPISEHCLAASCPAGGAAENDIATEGFFIDSEPAQNFKQAQEALRRRTITLKVGGRAELAEGRNVKIRCRIVRAKAPVGGSPAPVARRRENQQVEWRKDGLRIFAPNSTMADKQLVQETDNSILASVDLLADDRLQMDEPEAGRAARLGRVDRVGTNSTEVARESPPPAQRTLSLRSYPTDGASSTTKTGYHFVAQVGGRFSLVKENTLRIKRLRLDDSGTYTCSSGPLSESIELKVVARRRLASPAPPASSWSGGQAEEQANGF